MPEGNYHFIGVNPLGGIAKSKNVLVVAGSEVTIQLEPQWAYLDISLAFGTRALANSSFYIVRGIEHLGEEIQAEKFKTDSDGRYKYRIEFNDDIWIMREIEFAWFKSFDLEKYLILDDMNASRKTISVGESSTISLDYSKMGSHLVRINVISKANETVHNASLYPASGEHKAFKCRLGALVDGTWICVDVPSGSYDVGVEYEANGKEKFCRTRITVGDALDQAYDVGLQLVALTVEVQMDKDISSSKVCVTLLDGDYSPVGPNGNSVGLAKLDSDNKCTFDGLSIGKYQLLATVNGSDGKVKYSKRIRVSLTDDLSTTIKLTSNVGNFTFHLFYPKLDNEGKQLERMLMTRNNHPVVRFYNSSGNIVKPEDEFSGVLDMKRSQSPFTINSIRPGTYKVVISFGTYLPHTLNKVRIEKNRHEEFNVELKKGGYIAVELKNFETKAGQQVHCKFEDKDGIKLEDYGPIGNSVMIGTHSGKVVAWIFNLSESIERVEITISGYMPFYIKNNSKPGETAETTHKCVPIKD